MKYLRRLILKEQEILSKNKIKEALKIHGSKIKNENIEELIIEIDKFQNEVIDFEEYIMSIEKVILNSSSVEELSKALKMIDRKGNGIILTQDIIDLITTTGHKLSKIEAEELLKEFDPYNTGIIHYQDLLKK